MGKRTSSLTSQSSQEDSIATQAYQPPPQKSSSLPPANVSADGSERDANNLELESASQSQHSPSSASTRASSSTSSGGQRSTIAQTIVQRARARLCAEFGFRESDFPAKPQSAESFSPDWQRRAFRAYKVLSQEPTSTNGKIGVRVLAPALGLTSSTQFYSANGPFAPYAEEWQKENADSPYAPSPRTASAPSSVLSDISDRPPAPSSVSFTPTPQQSPSLLSPTSCGRRRTSPLRRHTPRVVAEDEEQDIRTTAIAHSEAHA